MVKLLRLILFVLVITEIQILFCMELPKDQSTGEKKLTRSKSLNDVDTSQKRQGRFLTDWQLRWLKKAQFVINLNEEDASKNAYYQRLKNGDEQSLKVVLMNIMYASRRKLDVTHLVNFINDQKTVKNSFERAKEEIGNDDIFLIPFSNYDKLKISKNGKMVPQNIEEGWVNGLRNLKVFYNNQDNTHFIDISKLSQELDRQRNPFFKAQHKKDNESKKNKWVKLISKKVLSHSEAKKYTITIQSGSLKYTQQESQQIIDGLVTTKVHHDGKDTYTIDLGEKLVAAIGQKFIETLNDSKLKEISAQQKILENDLKKLKKKIEEEPIKTNAQQTFIKDLSEQIKKLNISGFSEKNLDQAGHIKTAEQMAKKISETVTTLETTNKKLKASNSQKNWTILSFGLTSVVLSGIVAYQNIPCIRALLKQS